jgi:hypothetical protein
MTLYHPPVASDGGVCVSQLSAKSLNLVLSGQQTSAQLLCHILVVIPHSKNEGTKPPYVCPGCSNHTHGNNMINRCNVINKRVIFLT